MIKVFKFGGASIMDVQNIKNVGNILQEYANQELVIVFSAMGKVTNMLENVVDSYVQKSTNTNIVLQKVKDFHSIILRGIFKESHPIFDIVNNLFVEIEWVLEDEPNQDYAYDYDQIVSVGEFLSTQIMSAYLQQVGFENTWLDVRDLIRTDNTHRNAKIDWETTTDLIKRNVKTKHSITQGFLGCTSENFTSTLGREGSDFSAAILAFCLEASEVVIWKDVPGMMNADPKYFPNAKLLSQVSFDEAIELAFYGAKVIHPKTIQPLKQKNIPLRIKSFIKPEAEGSIVKSKIDKMSDMPSFIVKENQILISISDVDLSFIVGNHMNQIFSLLAKNNVEVNLMQNSAVSFSICVDNDLHKIPQLIKDFQQFYEVLYNADLSLFTLRHYNDNSFDSFLQDKDVVLEQKSRNTIQLIAR
jgi:aspartate kinase